MMLHVYQGSPTSDDMIRLVEHAVHAFGTPRFIIADHGCQFRRQFRNANAAIGITLVRGRVSSAAFNGKVERLFRTVRQWLRFSLLPMTLGGVQKRLDRFRSWFNQARPHQSLGAMTPDEVWQQATLPEPIPLRAGEEQSVFVDVRRRHHD